jgi:hypothetical protein
MVGRLVLQPPSAGAVQHVHYRRGQGLQRQRLGPGVIGEHRPAVGARALGR